MKGHSNNILASFQVLRQNKSQVSASYQAVFYPAVYFALKKYFLESYYKFRETKMLTFCVNHPYLIKMKKV